MAKGAAAAGVPPIVLSLKVDLDSANDKVKKELGSLSQTLSTFYQSTGAAVAASAIAGAVGAVAALGAAMMLTVGASSKFEDSFAGIKKTVDASDAEFKSLAGNIRQLATEIPIATSQLNQIGELGGQLGVSTGGLPAFIDTIAKLGVATRLSTETAALSLARLQTIFQLPENSVSNLASSLVDLGNNFAALEDEILSTSLRLAAGAKVAGATVADTLAIATALQAVGVQSQAGGTAMARVFQAITIALQGGTKEMRVFAQVTGLGVEGFKQLATDDPAQALNAFLIGLQRASDEGRNLVAILDELGLKQQRTIRALLAVAEAGDLLADTLNTANIAFDLNIALQDEANKRFETAKSQVKLLKNAFTELRIEIGNFFLPALKNILAGFTGLGLALAEDDKEFEGMTTTLKVFVGVITGLTASLGLLAGAFINIKMAALAANEGMIFFMKNTMTAQIAAGKFTATSKAMAAAVKFLTFNIGKLLGVLGLLTIAFMINQGANVKARRASEAYVKSIQIQLPLMEKIAQKEKEIEELRNSRTIEGNIVRLNKNSTAVELLEGELQALKEALIDVEAASARAFLNIPKFAQDVSFDEAKEAVLSFDKIISDLPQLDEIMQQEQEGSLFFIAPPEIAKDFAKEFDITVKEAQDILDGGFDTVTQFLNIRALEDENAFEVGGAILETYAQGIKAAIGQDSIEAFSTYTDEQRQFLENTLKFVDGFLLAGNRIRRIDSEQEMIMEGNLKMLADYNALAKETEGIEEITETEFIQNPEKAMEVFRVLSGEAKNLNTEMEDVVGNAEDLKTAFDDALAPLKDINVLISDIQPPEIINIDELKQGAQMMQDLETVLASGVFQLLEAGFPALALDFAEGGIEAKNMGKLIAIVNNGISSTDEFLSDMNNGIESSNAEIAGLTSEYANNEEAIKKHIQVTHGLVGDIADIEKNRAAIGRVLESQSKTIKAEGENYLNLIEEMLSMERSVRDAREDIKEMTQELIDMQADLVFDNIRITNEMKDQLTISEAKAELDKAIAEFGEEGVETSSERLNILQMEMNITRMQDQLENKMDKRRQKSIRDKKKEIKFLEMAVEQGVVEQLDLDAANEELNEMLNPRTAQEIEILEIQKELAEAELAVAEERAKGLSPQIISAIENYNKALDVTKDRDKDILDLTRDLDDATTDFNIELAKNADRYDEILQLYPDFKEKSLEIAEMIGIPEQMLQSALSGMETSINQFIGYVEHARKFRDQVIKSDANESDFFTDQGGESNFFNSDAYKAMQSQVSSTNFDNLISSIPFNLPSDPDIPITNTNSSSREGFRIQGFFEDRFNSEVGANVKKFFRGGFGGPDTYMNRAYGGNVPIGRASVVGEMGPEVIMSTPMGTSVFANKTDAGGSGVNIQNMNLNITGLPADPITARKVAQNIQKELLKLEKEGKAGTGLVNR